MKRTQSGSSWSGHARLVACQKHFRTRLLVRQSRGLHRTHYEGGETSAYKLTYVYSEGRAVCANANGGVVLLRPLHREEVRDGLTTHAGEQGGSSGSK